MATASVDPEGLETSRVNVLGVGISPISMAQALDSMAGWIASRRYSYVCLAPAHSVMSCQGDPRLARIFNSSGLTTPDGMSLVWLLRLKGYTHVERIYGPDLVLAACRRGLEHGWRHFLYGGAPGEEADLTARLESQTPGLSVCGTYTPPFRALTDSEESEMVKRVNATRPDVVWVGIGSPNQERWMVEHLGRIEAPVLVGVGAAFDFLSGRKPQAPRWMQRSGLEWLFRLATEPRRLWPRYRRYPHFALLVLAQELGLKRYRLET